MFRRIAIIITPFLALLAFPLSAYANGGTFDTSNVSYNTASSKELIFDISNFTPLPSNVDHYNMRDSGFYDVTQNTPLDDVYYVTNCIPSNHCDLVLNGIEGTYHSGDVVKIYTDLEEYDSSNNWLGNFQWFSNQTVNFYDQNQFKVVASPLSGTKSVGTPFSVNVKINDASTTALNAAQATVAISSNLSVVGLNYPTTNSCNFHYTKTPTVSDPSFAGAIFGGSSSGCTVYTLTLTPTATGTGTIDISNQSIKSYTDGSELASDVVNGSYTLNAGPTPTPTSGVPQLTVTSPLETYYLGDTYTLAGGKDTSITHVFVNSSETGVTFPTSTTWQVSETLAALGAGNTPSDNTFTIYGSDGTSSTATQTVDVSRHTLGDINGDGVVDLTDASLFATDYGKTDPSTFTYVLSNMNTDTAVDLTDLSILAKLEQ